MDHMEQLFIHIYIYIYFSSEQLVFCFLFSLFFVIKKVSWVFETIRTLPQVTLFPLKLQDHYRLLKLLIRIYFQYLL